MLPRMAPTFLWHDYETTGADPRRDRPAQFAAIRTTPDLEPVGEPVAFHCKPRWGEAPKNFTQAVTTTPYGIRVMTEYQFAGDKEAHEVPTSSR